MIKFNDFEKEYLECKSELLDTFENTLQSGWYVLGPRVVNFENEFSNMFNFKHTIGVGNGMDAIELILRALNIKNGDEVITTPLTAFATVLAILKVGATPVLCDIDPNTGLMDIQSAEKSINIKTKAILLVHLYGRIENADNFKLLCNKNNLFFIEDCAQSHGASENDITCGNFGIAGAYSFYPTKNLGAIGDGGAVVTNNQELFTSIQKLRNYGQEKRYYHSLIGMNSRLDELQAAILSVKLKYLEERTMKRKEIANYYFNNINNDNIQLLSKPLNSKSHVYHLFVIKLFENREYFQNYLTNNGIETLIHYPVPIHKQDAMKGMFNNYVDLNNSENFSNECISIPCHPFLKENDLEIIVSAINKFQL